MSNLTEIIAGTGIENHNRVTFDAANGKVGSFTIFTVTGLVAVKVIAVVESTVTSGGTPTIEVGTATNTAGIIAQVTDATGLAANEIWHDATPDSTVEAVSGAASFAEKLVSQDIQVKIGTAAITGGRIRFTVLWRPISANSYLSSSNVGGSASPSVSPSASISPSASRSPSASASSSASPSLSPSASVSPSASRSPSSSASASVSLSTSPSSSASASLSPSASSSPSASISPSSSVSPSPSPSA